MKRILAIFILGSYTLVGCGGTRPAAADSAAPIIEGVTTSTKSFSIDCAPTSVTVTARIADASGASSARLWYRVGNDRPYVPIDMVSQNGSDFTATVKGPDLPADRYGPLEFYVTAQDKTGQQGRSATNAEVQFLPCVSH